MDQESVKLVVTAVGAGLAATAKDTAGAIKEAYQALKVLVLGRLRGGGLSDDDGERLVAEAGNKEVGSAALNAQLSRVGVDDPTVEAARKLLQLLEAKSAKFQVDASHAKGVMIGDHGVQNITFH